MFFSIKDGIIKKKTDNENQTREVKIEIFTITSYNLKYNMFDRIKNASNCSSCGK